MIDAARVWVTDGDPVVVVVSGKLMYDTGDPVRETLLHVAGGPVPRIVVDLSEVALCDSSGLRILLQGARRAADQGGWLRLAGPQPMVRRVLTVTNLLGALPTFDTVAEAADESSPS